MYAKQKGYSKEHEKLSDDLIPDVTRENPHSELFIGDAKVGENELPSKQDSFIRITRYLFRAGLLVNLNRKQCEFVITTNTSESAKQWEDAVNRIVKNEFPIMGYTSTNTVETTYVAIGEYRITCIITP